MIILVFPKSISTIRVSKGTAITLGLMRGRQLIPPTNAYLMSSKGCQAVCKYCSQSRKSSSHEKLSRITWPKFSFSKAVDRLNEAFLDNKVRRVCLQVTNHSHFFEEIIRTFSYISKKSDIPLSVSSPPLSVLQYQELYEIGVRNVSVSLDGATPAIFDNIKGKSANGPYTWEKHWKALKDAVSVFGSGQVISHLIIGLGETEKEAISLIDELYENGVITALFAFTPLPNTEYDNKNPPKLSTYRKIQLARYLITKCGKRAKNFLYNNKKELIDFNLDRKKLLATLKTGKPFLTSGCPDCNRPFYNESVRGPWYNYPRLPTSQEILKIKKELDGYV